MYRLLIVDDEAGHRAGLIGLLRILKPEYLVFEAENGAVALSMMGVMEFDLVLTDIRMPQVDGLEFLERAKGKFPRARIAILSAYGVFDYAKRSVALGADDYLLKPVDAEELSKCLSRMEDQVQQRRHQDDQHNVEDLLHMFVTGGLSESNRQSIRTMFPAEDTGAVFCLLPVTQWPDDECRETIQYQLRERMKQFGGAVVFRSPIERDVLIGVAVCGAGRLWAVSETLAECIASLGVQVVAGMCSIERCFFDKLENAHTRARAACMQHFFHPEQSLFESGSDAEPDPYQTMRLDVSIKALDASLCAGDIEQTCLLLNGQIGKLCVPGAYPSKIKEVIMYTFIFLLGNLSHPLPRDVRDELLSTIDRTVLECRSMDEMLAEVRCALEGISSAIENNRSNQRDEVFQQVLRYIEDHYSEELSLSMISEQFHYHPSYFSTLFKQSVGATFSDYLTEMRMQEAARLLRESQMYAAKIGESVGYPGAAYFTKAFKRRFGMSPDQYRKRGR